MSKIPFDKIFKFINYISDEKKAHLKLDFIKEMHQTMPFSFKKLEFTLSSEEDKIVFSLKKGNTFIPILKLSVGKNGNPVFLMRYEVCEEGTDEINCLSELFTEIYTQSTIWFKIKK